LITSLSESKFVSPECAKSHLRASAISKFLPGVIPRTPVKRAKGMRRGKGKEIEGEREGKEGYGQEGREGRG
jgi:hypothetical protein